MRKIIALDLETTGFSSKTEDITEIGAAMLSDEGEMRSFSVLINTKRLIRPEVVKMNGITNDMLRKNGVSLAEGLEELRVFANGFDSSILWVGHNIRAYDSHFINAAISKHYSAGIKLSERNMYDTMLIFRAEIMGLKKATAYLTEMAAKGAGVRKGVKTSLEAAIMHYNIEKGEEYHRAEGDSLKAMKIFNKQINKNKWNYLMQTI